MSKFMAAVVVDHPGSPAVLTLRQVPRPQVKPGWSLIQVKAFGLNHSEIFTRQGLSPDVQFPRVLGIEAVGLVAETTNAARLPVGQRVVSLMGEMGRAFDGSYAEYVLLPNDQIYPVTTTLDWATLAGTIETGYTAYGVLRGLQLHDGERLLIRGGSSGVGVTAAKLAHTLAAVTVTSTTRQADKVAILQKQGAQHVFVGQLDQLPEAANFDKILDLIGPKTVPDSLQHLRVGGIVSATGQLGGQWTLNTFDPIMAIPNDRYLTSFYSGAVDELILQELLTIVASDRVDLTPEKVIGLSDIAAAHAAIEAGQAIGKTVVVVS